MLWRRVCQPLPAEAGTLDGSGCKPGYATAAGNLIGSITVGLSFSGLLTRVEIGQILVTAELRR
jgi:hypothetical protein